MNSQIEQYCTSLKTALLDKFGNRLRYMGLQGSYLRGDATEHSDIDIVVVLDGLTVADMDTYREILEEIGDADRSCGFICAKSDLAHWNPLECVSLLYGTKDLYGTLADLLPAYTVEDEVNFIKVSLNNLYHALCHTYIHAPREKLTSHLPGYYKSAFFILQSLHHLRTYRKNPSDAEFVLKKTDLLPKLNGNDRRVLETSLDFANGGTVDPSTHVPLLLHWCQDTLTDL